jgi:enamine deaminase RidA (YjgF/YER057c/UK114 family)
MQIRRLVNAKDPVLPHMTWTPAWQIGQEVILSGMTANANMSATLARAPASQSDATTPMYQQCMQVLEKIESWLEVAGAHRFNVVKTVIYVTDIGMKAEVGKARRDFFGEHYPLSTLVEVKGLVFPQLLVEIDAWARLDVDIREAIG